MDTRYACFAAMSITQMGVGKASDFLTGYLHSYYEITSAA